MKRLFLLFFLFALSNVSYAGTYPPSGLGKWGNGGDSVYNSGQEACTADLRWRGVLGLYTGFVRLDLYQAPNFYKCIWMGANGETHDGHAAEVWGCRPGDSLNSAGLCEEKCIPPKVYDVGLRVCVDKLTCPKGAAPPMSSGVGKGRSPPSVCFSGCSFPTGLCVSGGGLSGNDWNWACDFGPGLGQTCTDSQPGSGSPPPQGKAPCKPDEGVMTTSTGKVICVPSGTPGAEKPKVGTKQTTTKNPDGSSTTTTTVTTCTGAGACSSTTTTVIAGAGGGSSAGQAGQPGTTTKTTDTNSKNGGTLNGGGAEKDGGGDEGCDPTKQMCSKPASGDLYTQKDKTVSGSLGTFKDNVSNSGFGQGVTKFFSVSIPTGTCPQWRTSVMVMGKEFRADMTEVFCTQAAIDMMNIAGAVLMIISAFAAFKWAIL